jgi:predicted dehydrogenase
MTESAKARPRLRWGILGTGRIARQFATALPRARSSRLVAVATRALPLSNPDAFGAARLVEGYDALLDDAEVEAVYVATPHPTHAHWATRALAAGKHVLCEKPLAMTAAEAARVIAAARRSGRLLMEAFMFRPHPQTHRLVELLRAGVVGEVLLVQASFGYVKPYDPASRYFNRALGGGAILDVGGYCTAMARLIAGVAGDAPFREPLRLHGMATLAPTGVDLAATAELEFAGGILAQLAVANRAVLDNAVRIFGSAGRIEIPSPWFCAGKQGGRSDIVVYDTNDTATVHPIETEEWLYAIEADAFAASLPHQEAAWPAMSWEDTLGNMRVLDAWRAAAGVRYDADPERVENLA